MVEERGEEPFPVLSPTIPICDSHLALQLKELELQIKRQEHETVTACARNEIGICAGWTDAPFLVTPSGAAAAGDLGATASSGFDVSRHIKLVPPFREAEVDSYFIKSVAGIRRGESCCAPCILISLKSVQPNKIH